MNAYEDQYQAGYAAGVKGAHSSDNPYEMCSEEHKAWAAGQSDGNDDAVSAGC